MPDSYDLIVIGGGPGGLEAARRAALAGKHVLIIEQSGWGGTCTHKGCIPTKALLTCSKYYADLKKLKRAGINISGASVDFSAVKKHQQQIVKLAALGAQKMLAAAQVEIQSGNAEIISPREVKLIETSGGVKLISAGNIIIAWGSEPQVLPGLTLSPRILTSDGILNLDRLPAAIVIVGGSFIGVEFATFFAELGIKVTLLELLERILPQEDEAAAEFLKQELVRAGVTVHNTAQLIEIKETANDVIIRAQKFSEAMEFHADYVLLCTGRRPNLQESQLINCGIEYDRSGIKVNKNMMTSVSGIYAVGDVTGGMMLAHRAAQQAKTAVEEIYGNAAYPYDETVIPSVVYSHPQIAHVGWKQKQAQTAGLAIDIAQSSYSSNIMARTELLSQGFVKVLFYQDKLIGATIVGDNAAELIAALSLAVSGGLSRKQLRSWVIPHPTLSEIFLPLLD